ncbi:MAG: hypothetical protein U9R53_01175 [Chloroflexota bacterium]|nr:hypothetical protein [Chloroflexota bacterium]
MFRFGVRRGHRDVPGSPGGFINGFDVFPEGFKEVCQRWPVGVFGRLTGGEFVFDAVEIGGDRMRHGQFPSWYVSIGMVMWLLYQEGGTANL